tara:strand:- start:133 stop:357 length:225 start_codon:yes stop_codon:yes gene_type:complete
MHDTPTCSSDDGSGMASGWCPKDQEKYQKEHGHQVDYNFDEKLDSDIIASQDNVKREEKRLGNLSKDFGEKSQY